MARGANGRKGPMVLSALSNGVSGRYNFVLLLSVYSLYTIPSDTVVIQMSQGMTIEVIRTNMREADTSLVQTDQMEDDARKSNPKPGSVNEDRDDTHMDEVKAFFKEAGAGRRRKDDKDPGADDDMETAPTVLYSSSSSLGNLPHPNPNPNPNKYPNYLSICQLRVFIVKLTV